MSQKPPVSLTSACQSRAFWAGTGLLKSSGVFQSKLIVAFGGVFTGVFGGVHGDEGWFHQHLRNPSKIVTQARLRPIVRVVVL